MSKLELGKQQPTPAIAKVEGFGSLKFSGPTAAEVLKSHPELAGVVTEGTKLAYNKRGDLIADCKNLQICITNRQLPNAVMVDTSNAKPQVLVAQKAKLTPEQREDAFNAALAYVCGGDRSKIA
jgi:hypothetical protein